MSELLSCGIINDNVDYKRRIQQLLALVSNIDCRFCIGSTPNAIKAILLHNPDILFIDINLDERCCFEFLDEVRRNSIEPKIIFTASSPEKAIHALKCGAFDYLLYPIDFDDLKLAINRISENSLAKSNRYPKFDFMAKLTPKETEILHLLFEGKTSKTIAESLGITKNTVDTHRRKIVEKLEEKSILKLISRYNRNI